jgi:phage-related protein
MTTWANDVKSAFEGSGENTLVKKFYGIAKNVIDGFNKGISDFVTNSVNTVKSWASSLVSAVEDILDINSPSRVFKKLGGFTVEGFNKGIDANADSTTDHIADWVGKFSEFQADIKARLNVDSSDLQNYRPNLDNEFSSGATIKRELEETLVASGSVAAKVDSTTEFEEALERIVTPYLDKIADNTKATTDAVKENRKVSVEIDGREVAKATDKAKQNNGFSFTPQTA